MTRKEYDYQYEIANEFEQLANAIEHAARMEEEGTRE